MIPHVTPLVSPSEILATDGGAAAQLHPDICTLKPSLDPGQDYFAVFGLVPGCDIDEASLAATYRRLQQQVHPDRFTRECDRTQRLAQQQAAQVNAAYNTLRSPVSRAQYLLELAGQRRAPETTLHDPEFLVEQMMLRERLEESAGSLVELDALLADVVRTRTACWQAFSRAWQSRDWPEAQRQVDRLQFAQKLAHEIDERQSRLLDD